MGRPRRLWRGWYQEAPEKTFTCRPASRTRPRRWCSPGRHTGGRAELRDDGWSSPSPPCPLSSDQPRSRGPTPCSTTRTPPACRGRPPRAASKCSTGSRARTGHRHRAGRTRLHRTASDGPRRHPGTLSRGRRHRPHLPSPPQARAPRRSPRPTRAARASRRLLCRAGAARAPRRSRLYRRPPGRHRHCAGTTGDPRSSNCSNDSRNSVCGPIPGEIASTGISTTRCSCSRRTTGSTTTRPESTGRPLGDSWNP